MVGRLSFSANRSLISEAATDATFLHEKGVEHLFELRDTSILLGKIDQFGFQRTWEELGGKLAGFADFKNEDSSVATQISVIKRFAYDPTDSRTAELFAKLRRAGVDVDVSGNLLASYADGLILDAIRETGTTAGAKLADALEAECRTTP